MVQDVEKLGAELKAQILPDGGVLQNADVQIHKVWTDHSIASEIAQRARHRNRKAVWVVVPALASKNWLIVACRITDAVDHRGGIIRTIVRTNWINRAARRQARGLVIAVGKSQRQARAGADNPADLP